MRWIALVIGLLAAALAFAQQAPDSDVIRLGPGMTPPRLTHKEEPVYTRSALDAGVQGMILLEIVVD